jgi:hypothetical protein
MLDRLCRAISLKAAVLSETVANSLRALSIATQSASSRRKSRRARISGEPSRADASRCTKLHRQKFKEISMRKILLSAIAATTLLSAGLLASRAAATTPFIREAAVVCGGGNGCNVVQTKGGKQRKLQWLGHG